MSQPSFYKVVDTPVNTMTEDLIRKEINDLKREIVTIETRMGEKAAWAKAEGGTPEYLTWRARTKTFYGMLMKRYIVVRCELKELNRRKIST